jgi:hypothetical protein
MRKVGQFYGWAVVFLLAQSALRAHLDTTQGVVFSVAFGLTAGAIWQVTQRFDPVDRLASLLTFVLGSALVGGLLALGSTKPWWASFGASEVMALFIGLAAGLVFAEQGLRRHERGRTTLDKVHADTSRLNV